MLGERGAGPGDDRGGVAFAAVHRVLGGAQGLRERHGALAVGAFEVAVAAGQGQAVVLAHGGADLDADGDVEVAHELPDDGDLLGVLLAEVGHVGPDHVEELGHDGGDPVEVLGAARGAFERLGEPCDAHVGGEAGRVHLLGRGGEEHVDAEGGGLGGVGRLVAGVGGEVLAGAELGRVDEERDHDDVGVGAGAAHEGQVARVERAHGGHEPDRAAGAAVGGERLAQLGHGADGPHAGIGRWRRASGLGQCPGRLGERVPERQQLGRALGHRVALAGDGVLVAAGDRAGQGALGPGRGPVLHCGAHERDERGAVDPGGGGELLGRALERDQEVRGDAGRRVVGGAVGVDDLDRAQAEGARRACGRRPAPAAWTRPRRRWRRRRWRRARARS